MRRVPQLLGRFDISDRPFFVVSRARSRYSRFMEKPIDVTVPLERDSFELTPRDHFQLDYIAPPASLSDYITTLYYFRCDDPVIRDIQPAAIGHLALIPHGQGEMIFPCGRTDPSHEVNVMTPFSRAAPFEIAGPFVSIGAALSPLGWAALTGLNAAEHSDRFHRAGTLLGEEIERLGAQLCEDYRAGRRSGPECADGLCEYMLGNLKKVNPRHADMVKLTSQWVGASLNPKISDLLAQAAYSERQVQRLVERYFGMPPSALARKYRALRAAVLLSFPKLTPEWEAELAEAFFDQSHMIREIQRFVGRTPARLTDDDNPFLSEMLSPKNLREITMPEEPR